MNNQLKTIPDGSGRYAVKMTGWEEVLLQSRDGLKTHIKTTPDGMGMGCCDNDEMGRDAVTMMRWGGMLCQ